MKVVIVESPAKAKTINKYLGKDYEVYASFGHVRDLPAKDGSVDPDDDFAMLWEVDAKAAKRLSDIAGAVKDADRVILATDPDREGEAISWHVLRNPEGQEAFSRTSASIASCSTRSPRRPCWRRCAIRARSTRRSSTPIWRAARSTISSASICRRCCGASCRARARPAACNRSRCASSATASSRSKNSSAREYWSILAHLKTAGRRRRSPRASSAPTARRSTGSTSARARRPKLSRRRSRQAHVLGRRGRVEARQAPPLSALHHLDPAAGGVAQARPRAGAHHADRAAPLRRRRYRRRPGRPHYLYAHRRRRSRARGDRIGARKVIGKDFGDAICARRAAQIYGQGQERAGGARGDPSDRSGAPAARGRPPSRARTGEALRADLDAHDRQPDGERGARAHDASTFWPQAGARKLEFRATGQVVRFDGFLALYQEGRDDEEDEESGRLPAMAAGEPLAKERIDAEPAFHRAAAALHRGDAGQADGGARHRPPLDLCLDPRRPARSRLCAAREEAADPGGQGPARDRLPRSLLRQICRLRLHRRSRGEARQGLEQRDRLEGRCCATSGTISPRAIGGTKELAHHARCSTA